MKLSKITTATKPFIKLPHLTITTIAAGDEIQGWEITYKGNVKKFLVTPARPLKDTWVAMEKWFEKQK
jgi:hypothetical protein